MEMMENLEKIAKGITTSAPREMEKLLAKLDHGVFIQEDVLIAAAANT
jgi:hypothetical protein